MWAWKHTHSETGKTEYRELKGALVMDDVDFGYTDFTVLNIIESVNKVRDCCFACTC